MAKSAGRMFELIEVGDIIEIGQYDTPLEVTARHDMVLDIQFVRGKKGVTKELVKNPRSELVYLRASDTELVKKLDNQTLRQELGA